MNNILVIMLRYVGDVLLATPLLRNLRSRFPSANIAIAVNSGTDEVLRLNSDVNGVLVVPRDGLPRAWDFLRHVRDARYDCVLDLTDGDRSAIMSRVTGAPIRVGFNEEHYWRGLMYTSVITREFVGVHRVVRNLEALRPVGIEPKEEPLVLNVSMQEDEEASRLLQDVGALEAGAEKDLRLVMLQPGARYWFKAWPPERFAELADRLHQRCGCTILIGGDSREEELANEIRSLAHTSPIVLAGRTTLRQYGAVLRKCTLLVGNDNGPMHMASALKVPLVALFGPSNPAEWGPWGGTAAVLYKGLDCRSCFHPTCERGEESCMRQISVDEVFAAAERMLAGNR